MKPKGSTTLLLTLNWSDLCGGGQRDGALVGEPTDDDDDEVEDVPRVLEVGVGAEAEALEHDLCGHLEGEEDDERELQEADGAPQGRVAVVGGSVHGQQHGADEDARQDQVVEYWVAHQA